MRFSFVASPRKDHVDQGCWRETFVGGSTPVFLCSWKEGEVVFGDTEVHVDTLGVVLNKTTQAFWHRQQVPSKHV